MKKHYIQPTINAQVIGLTNTICVGSVHGNTSLKYGGGATNDPYNPNTRPM